jgi:hypothetical protein
MTDSTNYVHEEQPTGGFKQFIAQRWVRITGISLVAAIALVGAFGAGVLAGERIGGNNQSFGDRGGFSQQFGTQDGTQGGRQFGGPGGAPGGCPADDPDHCAGTDRGQHGFMLPATTDARSSATTGTSNP